MRCGKDYGILKMLSHCENGDVDMTTSSGSVQSVDRILDIVEALADVPLGLLLTDLAAATNLHVSTAHRLVNVLVDRGYALKEPISGKYRLTLRMFAMGSRASGVWNLLDTARPYLEELAAVSKEAVHLVERDGNSVVYLYKAEPYHQLVRMGSYTGLRNPMYCTGVGKSIMAFLPDAELEKLWKTEPITAFSENTIIDLDSMRQELAKIRQQGYAMDNEEHEYGIRCIAVAIRNWSGTPVAAVSISAPSARMDEEMINKMLPKLRVVADHISRMLGFQERSTQ